MMTMPVVVKEQIPHQVGAYVLGEEIGRGSVAVVYRATDMLYDREVALKVLHPYFAHYLAFVRYFITEGRDAARLRHPNIIQVFDAGQANGVAYIAQELVTGGTLADMLQARGGPFTLDETIAVIEQVSAGLDYAHHLGHLHRNLKPSNILFADQGRVQIADFSAAGPGATTTPANYPVGSPAFMAPEQARGETGIDQRADIYSLGVIAYTMLTGRLPFEAENPLILLRKIVEEAAPAADQLNPAIDPSTAQVLSQVLAKKANARFLTASAFARALTHGDSAPVQRGSVQRETLPLPLRVKQRSTGVRELPAVSAPSDAAPRSARLKTKLAQRTILVLAMMGVTALLLLLIIAIRLAPSFFTRIASQTTPQPAHIAVLTIQPFTPTAPAIVRASATTGTRLATPPTKLESNGAATSGALTGTAAVTATAPAVPPPTIKVLPTPVPTFTPVLPTPVAPAFTPAVPDGAPGSLALLGLSNVGGAAPVLPITPTSAITTGVETVATETVARPPGGRIAYTVWNPRTDRLDTVIYNLATGVRWPVLENTRQPDFNNQSDLALNGEGGNVDNLVLVRPDGEILLDIMSAHAEDGHPHWAPNNKKIVFDSRLVGDGRYRLYLQYDDAYGQQVKPMMFDAWEIFGRYPVFLLDDRIAYNGCDVWENGSTCGIYVVDIYGGQPSGLTGWPRDIPTDNLGANILAMSDRSGNWDVYLVNAANGAVEQLTDHPGRDGLATASPDGNYIAFVTDREGAWAVYIMQVDGSNQHKLFDLGGDYGRDDRDWLQERLSWGR